MKNTTTVELIASEQKAVAYFCELPPLQAKKVLFALTKLKGEERLDDSPVTELRVIAKFYDGMIIQSKVAKEMASKLAKAYANTHPKTLFTKKEIAAHTHASYRKLLDALGEYGFDYVVSMLRNAKAYIAVPNSGVDEKQMLKAMRWAEKRQNVDAWLSDRFHHRKGLEYAGFKDEVILDYIVKYSFIIANVYEIVQPAGTYTAIEIEEPATETCENEVSVRQMKIHFIEQAELIMNFYGVERPEIPEGYVQEDFEHGSVIVNLAERGVLNRSNEILEYIRNSNKYNLCYAEMTANFSEEEMTAILENKEAVMNVIANEW